MICQLRVRRVALVHSMKGRDMVSLPCDTMRILCVGTPGYVSVCHVMICGYGRRCGVAVRQPMMRHGSLGYAMV